jgi:hypothetical protein
MRHVGMAVHVGYRGKTGNHLLVVSFTGFGPTAVIGRTEIPQCSSLLPLRWACPRAVGNWGAAGQIVRAGNTRAISRIEHASALGAREPQVPLDGSCLFWKTLAGAGSAPWLEQPPLYRRPLVDRDHARWLSLLALHDR